MTFVVPPGLAKDGEVLRPPDYGTDAARGNDGHDGGEPAGHELVQPAAPAAPVTGRLGEGALAKVGEQSGREERQRAG